MLSVGIGLSVNNAKAVLEALFGHESEFTRTPKYAVEKACDEWKQKRYRGAVNFVPFVELALGVYFTVHGAATRATNGIFGTLPFILIFQFGFLYTGRAVAVAEPGQARRGPRAGGLSQPSRARTATAERRRQPRRPARPLDHARLNVAVSAAKIIVGKLSGSMAMVADGYHSLTDGGNNIAGLVITGYAYAPPDEGHPYGHRKFETAATLGLALALLSVSYHLIARGALAAAAAELPEIGPLAWAVMLVTLVVNMFVASYEARQGRKLQSAT